MKNNKTELNSWTHIWDACVKMAIKFSTTDCYCRNGRTTLKQLVSFCAKKSLKTCFSPTWLEEAFSAATLFQVSLKNVSQISRIQRQMNQFYVADNHHFWIVEKKREFGTGKLTTIVTNRSQSKLKGDKVVWNYGNGPENFATGYSLKIESRSSSRRR